MSGPCRARVRVRVVEFSYNATSQMRHHDVTSPLRHHRGQGRGRHLSPVEVRLFGVREPGGDRPAVARQTNLRRRRLDLGPKQLTLLGRKSEQKKKNTHPRASGLSARPAVVWRPSEQVCKIFIRAGLNSGAAGTRWSP